MKGRGQVHLLAPQPRPQRRGQHRRPDHVHRHHRPAHHSAGGAGGGELRGPLPGGGETRCGRLEPGWVEERGEVSESDESQRFHS